MQKSEITLGEIVTATPFNFWAAISAFGYMVYRFARWFVLRERVQFWVVIDSKIKDSEVALRKDMEEQFSSVRKYLSQAIHGKNNAIAARDGVIDASNEAMLKALSTIEKLQTQLKNTNG